MGGTCTPQNLPVGKLSSQDQTGYPLSSPRPRATDHPRFFDAEGRRGENPTPVNDNKVKQTFPPSADGA